MARNNIFSAQCGSRTVMWVCTALLLICSAWSPSIADTDVSISASGIEKQVFDLINAERDRIGISPLIWDTRLYDAARGHSEDMALENYFSHTRLNGRDLSDRVKEAGYDESTASEITGAGQTTAQQVFENWITSDGLRENLLEASYSNAAVGHAINEQSDWKNYWTLAVGRVKDMDQSQAPKQDHGPGPEPDAGLESKIEPLTDSESESKPLAEPVADENGFCEELVERHSKFCKTHPDICWAVLNRCRNY